MPQPLWEPATSDGWLTLLSGIPAVITLLDHNLIVLNQFNAEPAFPLSAQASQPFADLLPDPVRVPFLNALDQTRSMGETQVLELQHPFAFSDDEGTQARWYRHEIKRINLDPEQTGIAIYSTDMSESKRLEAELRHNERRFRAIFENAPDGVTIARRNKNNYAYERRLLDINPRGTEIYGYSRDEIFAMSWKDFLPPDEIEKVVARFQEQGKEKLTERRLIRKDGSEVWIDSMMIVIPDVDPDDPDEHEIIIVFREITERKRLERELREVSQRFRSLADSLPATIILTDLDENYLYVNNQVANSVGMPQEAFVGLKITDVVKIPEHVQQWRDQMVDVFRAQAPVTTEYTFTYDGKLGHNLITLVPQFDPDGRIISILAHAVDLLEIYQREEALREARIQAEHAIQVRDRFLANISHELRTPLNIILGFGRLLSEGEALTEKAREYLGAILNSGQYLAQLVHDMLDVSRIELEQLGLEETVVDLHRCIQQIVATQQERAKAKGLALTTEIEPDVPVWIKADQTRLRQVILNLVDNAIRYTDTGSIKLRLSCGTAAETLLLEVLDTGRGISDDMLGDIFDAFVTDRKTNDASSIGLGLYITRALVNLMGGCISAENRPEGGSNFQVAFPLKRAAPDEIASAVEADMLPTRLADPNTEYRVMVIDDVASNLDLLQAQLTLWGFAVDGLRETSTALDRIREWQPQLILLDLYLPDIDGFTLAEQIRRDERFRDIVIVAVTASAVSADHARAVAVGFDDLLTKPIHFGLLADKLSKLLNVQFLYQEGAVFPYSRKIEAASLLTDADLSKLPDSWLRRMYVASVMILPADAMTLLSEIENEHPDLTRRMREMIDRFQISHIAALIDRFLEAKR